MLIGVFSVVVSRREAVTRMSVSPPDAPSAVASAAASASSARACDGTAMKADVNSAKALARTIKRLFLSVMIQDPSSRISSLSGLKFVL